MFRIKTPLVTLARVFIENVSETQTIENTRRSKTEENFSTSGITNLPYNLDYLRQSSTATET